MKLVRPKEDQQRDKDQEEARDEGQALAFFVHQPAGEIRNEHTGDGVDGTEEADLFNGEVPDLLQIKGLDFP